ncbi:hypothetical protein KY385_00215 [Candidatus Parcubacteria bacterium]|nr:hypothetical protein [Candidatus Parcubacteria bacterium]
MDLNNRSFRPSQQVNTNHNEPASAPQQSHPGPGNTKKGGRISRFRTGGILKVTYVFLLFSVTVVLVGVLLSLVFFKNDSREERFVDPSKYQAVFLNNGQVYFGHINELNRDFLSVSDIYYLRVNQQVQPDQKEPQASQNDVSLVKLGCELHGPQDSMVINRSQITFWENLKDDGQVAKAVAEYKKANPNGQDCEQQNQQNNPNPESSKPSSTEDSGSAAPNENSPDNTTDNPPANTEPNER